MTFHVNTHLIVQCGLYFAGSAILARLFKGANLFFKIILLFLIAGVLKEVSATYRTETLLSILAGIVFVYIEDIVDFFSAVKCWIENVLYGIRYRLRIIAGLVGKVLFAVRWLLRLVFIPTANLFTWFYNFLSRTFRWNLVFIPLTEQFRRKSRKSESRRPGHESWRDKSQKTSSNTAEDEQVKRAREKVRQAREEAERAKKAEEQQPGRTANDRRTPRQILGLGETFTLEELKRAYRSAASRYHPDNFTHMSEAYQREAQAEFVKAKAAYDVLMKEFL